MGSESIAVTRVMTWCICERTSLNFLEASSEPELRSGCHFRAYESSGQFHVRNIHEARVLTIFLYAFLMSSSLASRETPRSL